MVTTKQKWRMLLAWLRRNFSLSCPANVRTLKMKKLCGYTTWKWNKQEFFIRVHKNQCFTLRTDTLIHEWAHALTWFGAETNNEDHSAEWGIAYAKIYRTFLEWNWGKGPDEEG